MLCLDFNRRGTYREEEARWEEGGKTLNLILNILVNIILQKKYFS